MVAVSDSSGSISVLDMASMERLHHWTAHEFPAWITAFDYHDTSFIYSGIPFLQTPTQLNQTGGDDCRLKGWDVRQGFAKPAFLSKRSSGNLSFRRLM